MKTNVRQVNGVTIVDMSGRITLGEGAVVLRDAVRPLAIAPGDQLTSLCDVVIQRHRVAAGVGHHLDVQHDDGTGAEIVWQPPVIIVPTVVTPFDDFAPPAQP